MYDELDMALEDAYDDGYVQALLDMGVDPEDIAEEDVDMFDDNYFDDAMEGNPVNKIRRRAFDREGAAKHFGNPSDDSVTEFRRQSKNESQYDRNLGRRSKDAYAVAHRDFRNDTAGGNPSIQSKSGSIDRKASAFGNAATNILTRQQMGLNEPARAGKIYRDRKAREERAAATSIAARKKYREEHGMKQIDKRTWVDKNGNKYTDCEWI